MNPHKFFTRKASLFLILLIFGVIGYFVYAILDKQIEKSNTQTIETFQQTPTPTTTPSEEMTSENTATTASNVNTDTNRPSWKEYTVDELREQFGFEFDLPVHFTTTGVLDNDTFILEIYDKAFKYDPETMSGFSVDVQRKAMRLIVRLSTDTSWQAIETNLAERIIKTQEGDLKYNLETYKQTILNTEAGKIVIHSICCGIEGQKKLPYSIMTHTDLKLALFKDTSTP